MSPFKPDGITTVVPNTATGSRAAATHGRRRHNRRFRISDRDYEQPG
jgi:hypothetical protein